VLQRLSRNPLEPVERRSVAVLAPAGFTDIPGGET
jgi:hypothetical protein